MIPEQLVLPGERGGGGKEGGGGKRGGGKRGGKEGTSYSGLYGEAPPERGAFFDACSRVEVEKVTVLVC